VIVRATEAYTARLPGHRRALLPMHSWMIATEPLSAATWKEIGLESAETFGDGRGITTYGQRTADGRIAFGGLATYRYGSRIEPSFPDSHPNFRTLEGILRELVPALRDARITHHWGGALAIPRDWRPRVGLDRERGRAWIGGYVGEGVAAANLAGRTLAELIAGETTERTEMPFVAAPARAWEVEPLRYFAVRSVLELIGAADRASEPGEGARWRERLVRAIARR
jgi:glycine/D-amino acid oxidase-like deaminating enzyme